jgi:hypothetical protein
MWDTQNDKEFVAIENENGLFIGIYVQYKTQY